jgi:hypothetical protein
VPDLCNELRRRGGCNCVIQKVDLDSKNEKILHLYVGSKLMFFFLFRKTQSCSTVPQAHVVVEINTATSFDYLPVPVEAPPPQPSCP